MKLSLPLIACSLLAVSACATVSSYETINGQRVAVGQTSNGQTIKRFPYIGRTNLTVRYDRMHATVTHVREYPATDTQKRSFVEQASNCKAGALIEQHNQATQGGITLTTYLLSC